MRRGRYRWLAASLLVPSPAFALSPALSAALGNLLNAQLIASLVLIAIAAVWVPQFIRRMVLERELREQLEVESAYTARLTEHYFPDEGASIRRVMTDDQFMSMAQAGGWEVHTGAVFDTEDQGRTAPDRAGYDFDYEFHNTLQGLEMSAPSAPGVELGWNEEDFARENERVAALSQMRHIESLNASAWDEFRDDLRGAIDDELGDAVPEEWVQEEFERRSAELYTFLPAPVFESEPDPLDDPEQEKWASNDYRYAIT